MPTQYFNFMYQIKYYLSIEPMFHLFFNNLVLNRKYSFHDVFWHNVSSESNKICNNTVFHLCTMVYKPWLRHNKFWSSFNSGTDVLDMVKDSGGANCFEVVLRRDAVSVWGRGYKRCRTLDFPILICNPRNITNVRSLVGVGDKDRERLPSS